MYGEVAICNGALQKLGASKITSLNERSRNAVACSQSYAKMRDSELRSYPWSFAIRRAVLAVDAESSVDGLSTYQLPDDFIRLLSNDPRRPEVNLNWVIEGRKIVTSDKGPLHIRYISRVEDTSIYDPLFIELLEYKIAIDICEEITQSNTKKDYLTSQYELLSRKAKKVSASEKVPVSLEEDSWVTGRL